MQFLDTAMMLNKEALRIAAKIPKKYRYTVGQRFSDLSWEITDHVKKGNRISAPQTTDEVEIRISHFQEAIEILTTSFVTALECAKQLEIISYHDMESLISMIEDEIRLLRGVIKSDKAKFKKQFAEEL